MNNTLRKETVRRRLPPWLKMQRANGENYPKIKKLVSNNNLHTICVSANCPNIGECWNAGTATFMILGDICTRSCKFCGVKTGKPLPVDRDEPKRLASSIKAMKLKHAVITSVDRDDLDDSGSGFWAETIVAIKRLNPEVTIEALIPDFDGREEDIIRVINAGPDVISHNLETVRRLTPGIRSRAKYDRSIEVLKFIALSGVTTKSGIMAGLGETDREVLETMDDLLLAGCTVMTIGQYLQPTFEHYPVIDYITTGRFEQYRITGLEKGFKFIESSPLVRSSYHAEKHVDSGVKVEQFMV